MNEMFPKEVILKVQGLDRFERLYFILVQYNDMYIYI
jgi:hypothetical protein